VKCRCDSAARVAEMPTESTWQQCVVTRCYPSKHWHTKTVETRAGRSVGREIIAASRRCTLQSQHHLRVSCALRLVPSRCRSFSRVLQTRPVKVEVTLRYVTRDVATCCGDRTVTPPPPRAHLPLLPGGGATVGCRTCDQEVAGSIPGQDAAA